MLGSNCSSYLLETFSPKELYLLALGISMFTALTSMSFYSLMEKLKKLSKKHKPKVIKQETNTLDRGSPMNKNNMFETPQKQQDLEEEKKHLLPRSGKKRSKKKVKKSMNMSISELLGESQFVEGLVEYKKKLISDFEDIWAMLKDPQLKLLLLVVTLENITPEISCIFFYYFIEILRFSYFDVNSVFVFASVGFLISLAILNCEFTNSSFEQFYKVTSFLLAIAYYLNLR